MSTTAVPEVTERALAPALALLGASTPAADVCWVLTSAKAPYTIRAASNVWCRTWECDSEVAVGKTLDVIAGPRSSNDNVGARLAEASPTPKAAAATAPPLGTWVDCGVVTNYTMRSVAPLEHHLVIGPLCEADGSVQALVGVSHVLGRADFADAAPASAPAALVLGAGSTSASAPAADAAAAEPPLPRFKAMLHRPATLDEQEQSGPAAKPAAPRPSDPTAAPKLPMRYGGAASMRPAHTRRSADDERAASPKSGRVRSYGEDLASLGDTFEAGFDDDIPAFRELLQRSDMRIVLRESAKRAALPIPARG